MGPFCLLGAAHTGEVRAAVEGGMRAAEVLVGTVPLRLVNGTVFAIQGN